MVAVIEYGQAECSASVRSALDRRGLTAAPGVTVMLGRDVEVCRRALLDGLGRRGDRVLVVLEGAALGAPAAWDLLDAGADDVVAWQEDGAAVDAVAARVERWVAVEQLLDSPVVTTRIVGRSPAVRAALRQLIELSLYGQGPILLLGQTGTGKELAAQLVHALASAPSGSGDRRGELVVVDCTTIVPTLSGSELFGHERGAFTGADRARTGAVAQADGGTLFLDEVGDLPVTLQGELLRVVQEGVYKRVGGSAWNRTTFRLVSATHRDLLHDQRRGRFRSDLYHRISSGVVRLPPLRDRPGDVEELFATFLAQALRVRTPPPLSPVVADMLRERSYPGNVRELRQLATRVAARHVGGGPVTVGDIPPADRPGVAARASRTLPTDPGDRTLPTDPGDRTLPTDPGDRTLPAEPGAIAEFVRAQLRDGLGLRELKALVGDLAVELVLAEEHGNLRVAAERLGVTVRALQLRRRGTASHRT